MNDFAQFFKRTQVQQIYVVLVCSLLMYAFLYVEIPDFRELDYRAEVTLALASGCLVGFVSISLSYIYYYSLYENSKKKAPMSKCATETSTCLPGREIKQEEGTENDISNKVKCINDDSYLGLALFFSITALIFMYILWCSGVVDYITRFLFLFNMPLSTRNRLFAFFMLYVFSSIVCIFLSGYTHILKDMFILKKNIRK